MSYVTNDEKLFRKTQLLWTAIFTVSIVLVVGIAAGFIFFLERNRIARQFDSELLNTANLIERRLRAPGFIHVLPGMRGYQFIFIPKGQGVQLVLPNGEVFLEAGETFERLENFHEGFSRSGNFRVFTKKLDIGGNVLYLRVARDISELVDRERRLAFMYVLLVMVTGGVSWIVGYFLSGLALSPAKEAYENLKRFSMDASHELKTPLTILKTSLDVLEYQRELPAEVVEKLSIMRSAVEKMTKQVNQLLILAKSGEYFKNPIPENVNVKGLLEEVARTFKPKAELKGLELEVLCPDDLSIFVEREVLKTILDNLVDNAVKFTERGKVTLGAYRDRKTVIYVKDTGPGIPKKEQKKVFERFYRLSREKEGSGLGLAIVKELAKRLKASVILESEEGKGSTFKIVL